MKTIQITLISLTGILLFTTVVCGIWMRYSGSVIEEADKTFHMVSGILAVILVAVTLFMTVRR